jgi:hypothetical protein
MIKSIFKVMILCIITVIIESISKLWIMQWWKRAFQRYRAFQTKWLYSWIQIWKKRESKVLKSAHDYSCRSGSYSLKQSIQLLQSLQNYRKSFMCSNCFSPKALLQLGRYRIGKHGKHIMCWCVLPAEVGLHLGKIPNLEWLSPVTTGWVHRSVWQKPTCSAHG